MKRKVYLMVGVLELATLLCATSQTRGQDTVQTQPSPDTVETNWKEKDTKQPLTTTRNAPVEKSYEDGSDNRRLPMRFLKDQEEVWTSPAHLRASDLQWLVPVGGVASLLFATDTEFSKHLSHSSATLTHYKNLSNAGVAALVGAGGGMWLASHVTHNSHWRETGFLAGEAALNSLVVTEAMKYSFQRERPLQDSGNGSFFRSGGTSFPSEHATVAWSVAGILAHEYPGPLTKLMAYGLASAVSISRVRARQHFPSDTFAGAMIGELVAQHIFSEHHDPDLGGAMWQSIGETFRSEITHSSGYQGSPYVPLDSWVYPALDRLAGLGLIDSGFSGMRPWTRRECVRLLGEAQEKLGGDEKENAETGKLVAALEREFRFEIEGANGDSNTIFKPESVYTRTENISGMPLHDSYHFAQTEINDFGRPYGEGWNTITGFSAYGTAGIWTGYLRGEWQTAPSVPAFSLGARQTIQKVDDLPQLPPGAPTPSVSQFAFLDTYVGLTLSSWQISFGRQSLWWGPGDGGPLEFSDNPAPMNMLRISRVSPLKLPGILGWLGPMRVEVFLSQVRAQFFENDFHHFIGSFSQPLNPQPYIHGEKINFKPTSNFEFGFSRNAILGGPTDPLTFGLYLKSLFPGIDRHSQTVGLRNYSGDQQSELDWSYRLPKLRNWLTFYGDAFSDDEISPIAYLDRSAIHAGLYLSHVPWVPKLDLRAEGVYTDVPPGGALGHGFYYFSTLVPNGETSGGYLLGNWVGRDGQGAQAWSTYWLSPRNKIQFQFRHQKVSNQFIPGGGTVTDGGVSAEYSVRSDLEISAGVQVETWTFPILAPLAHTNVTSSVQLTYWPRGWSH